MKQRSSVSLATTVLIPISYRRVTHSSSTSKPQILIRRNDERIIGGKVCRVSSALLDVLRQVLCRFLLFQRSPKVALEEPQAEMLPCARGLL
jgi:hypothetical protein